MEAKKAFIKEVVAELPKPKPHYNTVSTVSRKMEDKGFINHEAFGNTHRYYPNISKEDYRQNISQQQLIIISKILIKM
jgi:predicted transcriptional regulator